MFGKEAKDAEEHADDKRSKLLKLARAQSLGLGEKALTAGIYLELAAIHDLLQERATDRAS